MRFACFGDSITSEEVSGIGTLICSNLGAELVGNYGHGNASCADWSDHGKVLTEVCLDVPFDFYGPINTLSNQIRRFLAEGKTADVFYIAICGNDGKDEFTPVVDDCEARFAGQCDPENRTTMCGALIWAVSQLRMIAPAAKIFMATPLRASGTFLPCAFSEDALMKKREIVIKTAKFLGVELIDSYTESPFDGIHGADDLGIHPKGDMRQQIADFVTEKIRQKL